MTSVEPTASDPDDGITPEVIEAVMTRFASATMGPVADSASPPPPPPPPQDPALAFTRSDSADVDEPDAEPLSERRSRMGIIIVAAGAAVLIALALLGRMLTDVANAARGEPTVQVFTPDGLQSGLQDLEVGAAVPQGTPSIPTDPATGMPIEAGTDPADTGSTAYVASPVTEVRGLAISLNAQRIIGSAGLDELTTRIDTVLAFQPSLDLCQIHVGGFVESDGRATWRLSAGFEAGAYEVLVFDDCPGTLVAGGGTGVVITPEAKVQEREPLVGESLE